MEKTAAERPVLRRLSRKLLEHRRRLIQAAFVRAAAEALCLQLFLMPVLGWISASHPYQASWLEAVLATYVVYLWPFISGWRVRMRPSLRLDRLAKHLDGLNQGSPDIFQTLLSLGNHPPETRASLDRFYSGWESRLRIPKPVWMGRLRGRLLGIAVLFAMALPLFSHHYGEVVYRMAFPARAWRMLPVPKLEPLDLPERVVLGDTLHIGVGLRNLPESEPVYASLRVQGREERYPLERRGDTAWLRNGPVQGDLAVRFSALNVQTSEYRIRAVPPPSLRSFSAIVQPPAYTHSPPESLSEIPEAFSVLPGGRIFWKASSIQPLRELAAIFKAADSTASDTVNLGSGRNFSFRTTMRNPMELRLRWVTQDVLAGSAGPYRIERGIDAPPDITILSPMDNGELGRSSKLAVAFRAHDDFGVSRVVLHYSVVDGGTTASQGIQDVSSWLQAASGMGEGLWDMGNLLLRSGNVLEIYLEATDNNDVSGPQTARSATVRLRMPFEEEVVAGMDAGENRALTSLKSAEEREDQARNASEKTTSQTPENALQTLSPWEVRRILSAAPQDHLQRLERHLAAEAAQANRETPLGKQLESLRHEAKGMEAVLPPDDAAQKPLPEQKRLLDTLMSMQQKLDQSLSQLKPPSSSRDSLRLAPLAGERQALREELRRNLQEQKDLHGWMEDQERQQAAQQQDLEQSQQAEQRAREDVQQALSQMKETLRKGMENGAISPELLEKMQRIQDLLKEALPDSALNRLNSEAQNQQVGVQDLQRNLKSLLDQKADAREGLDRAIRMLEMLRDMHALEAFSKEAHELQKEQERLAERIEKTGDSSESAEKLQSRQSALRQRLRENRRELDRLAQDQKAFRELKTQSQPQAREAEEKMRAAESALNPNSPDRSQARHEAKAAAEDLKQMENGVDDLLGRMQGGPDPSEIAAVLDETLEFGRWLELIRDKNERMRQGWEEEDAALDQRADQLAHWLRGRMESLVAAQPYKGEVLRREAAAMSFQADALLTVNSPSNADSLRVHTRKAARELLKWLQQANAGGGDGSGEAGGSGTGGDGGGGEGKGQGEGDDEGLDGLAGRLRGVSGKQMAVNDATYQLLRSMLEGRRPGSQGQGSQSGGLTLPGT